MAPVWVLLLYEDAIAERNRRGLEKSAFDDRVRAAVEYVGKRGGVNSEKFCAALRLGGWDAARQLLPN
jgi:hypothetical protein